MVNVGSVEIGLKLDKAQYYADLNAIKNSSKDLGVTIVPNVDHRPLTALNRHIDKKIAHLKELRREAQKPIVIKYKAVGLMSKRIDKNNVSTKEQEARSSANIFKKINSNINNFRKQQDKVSQSSNSLLKAQIDAIKSTKKGTIGNIITGGLEGIGKSLTQDFGKGLSSSVENQLSEIFGSFELLGKTFGQKAGKKVKENIEKINKMIESEIEKEQSKPKKERSQEKLNALKAVASIKDSAFDSLNQYVDPSDKQGELAKQAELRRQQKKTDSKLTREGNIALLRESDTKISRVGKILEIEQKYKDELSEINQLNQQIEQQVGQIDVEISKIEEQFIKAQTKDEKQSLIASRENLEKKQETLFSSQVKLGQKGQSTAQKKQAEINAVLDTLSSAEKTEILEIASSQSEAGTKKEELKQYTAKLEDVRSNRDKLVDLSLKAAETGDIELVAEINKEIEKENKKIAKAEKVKKGVEAEISNLEVPVNNLKARKKELTEQVNTELDKYQTQYIQIVQEVFGEVDLDNMPELVESEALESQGARAAYNAKFNKIFVSPDALKRIESGEMTLEDVTDLAHELVHAKDFSQGTFDGLINRKTGNVDVSDITNQEKEALAPFLDMYVNAGDSEEVIKTELSAEAKAQRIVKKRKKEKDQQRINQLAKPGKLQEEVEGIEQLASTTDALVKSKKLAEVTGIETEGVSLVLEKIGETIQKFKVLQEEVKTMSESGDGDIESIEETIKQISELNKILNQAGAKQINKTIEAIEQKKELESRPKVDFSQKFQRTDKEEMVLIENAESNQIEPRNRFVQENKPVSRPFKAIADPWKDFVSEKEEPVSLSDMMSQQGESIHPTLKILKEGVEQIGLIEDKQESIELIIKLTNALSNLDKGLISADDLEKSVETIQKIKDDLYAAINLIQAQFEKGSPERKVLGTQKGRITRKTVNPEKAISPEEKYSKDSNKRRTNDLDFRRIDEQRIDRLDSKADQAYNEALRNQIKREIERNEQSFSQDNIDQLINNSSKGYQEYLKILYDFSEDMGESYESIADSIDKYHEILEETSVDIAEQEIESIIDKLNAKAENLQEAIDYADQVMMAEDMGLTREQALGMEDDGTWWSNNIGDFFDNLKEQIPFLQNVETGIQGVIYALLALKGIEVIISLGIEGLGLAQERIQSEVVLTVLGYTDSKNKLEEIRGNLHELGLESENTANSFATFAAGFRFTNLSAETDAIFSSLNLGAAALQLPQEKVERLQEAFLQMAGKSVVGMEELRQQVGDALPGAFSLAAKSLMVTERELNKLVESGSVMAEDLLPALAEQLESAFAPQIADAANSYPAQIQKMQNTLTNITASFGETGIEILSVGLPFVNQSLEVLNENASILPGILFGVSSSFVLMSAKAILSIDLIKGALVNLIGFMNKTVFTINLLKGVLSALGTGLVLGAASLVGTKALEFLQTRGSKEIETLGNNIGNQVDYIKTKLAEINDIEIKIKEPKTFFEKAYDSWGNFLDSGLSKDDPKRYQTSSQLKETKRKSQASDLLDDLAEGYAIQAIRLSDNDEVEKYIKEASDLNQKIKEARTTLDIINQEGNLQAKDAVVQSLSQKYKGDTDKAVEAIEEEIKTLTEKKKEIDFNFAPGGINNLEKLLEQAKESAKEFYEQGLTNEAKEAEKYAEKLGKALFKVKEIAKQVNGEIANTVKTIREANAINENLREERAGDRLESETTLINNFLNNQTPSESRSILESQNELTNLQEDKATQEAILRRNKQVISQLNSRQRRILENALGQELEKAEAGNINKARESLEEGEKLTPDLDQALNTLEEINGTLDEIALIDNNIARQKLEQLDLARDLQKNYDSLQQELKDFQRDTERQLIDFERAVSDFNREQFRSFRGLAEQWDDLYRSIDQQTLAAINQIEATRREIETIQLQTRFTRLNPQGFDNPLQAFSDAVVAIRTSFNRLQGETDKRNETRLQIETDTINIARQVRNLQEQQEDLERQRLVQLEQFRRQQEDFDRTQYATWQDILSRAKDIETQAYQLGVSMDAVGVNVTEQGNALVMSIHELAKRINGSVENFPVGGGSESSSLSSAVTSSQAIASGLFTGPSANIGGSSAYHIDTKIPKAVGYKKAIEMIDAVAKGYEEQGRVMEFSNSAVSGIIWDYTKSLEEKRKLLERIDKAHSHSPNPGYWDMDYYIPKKGQSRHGETAKGVEMLFPKVPGSAVSYGRASNYGNWGQVRDAQGNVIWKQGHGDNRKPLPSNTTIPSIARNTPQSDGAYRGGNPTTNRGDGIPLSPQDLKLLQKIVLAEALSEGTIGQALVARSILNRSSLIKSGKISPGTYNAQSGSLRDVIYARNQYQPVANGTIDATRTQAQMSQALAAIELAFSPSRLSSLLEQQGIGLQARGNLLSATGFRTGWAFNDPSQNFNRSKYKNHVFNSDRFAQNLNVRSITDSIYGAVTTAPTQAVTTTNQPIPVYQPSPVTIPEFKPVPIPSENFPGVANFAPPPIPTQSVLQQQNELNDLKEQQQREQVTRGIIQLESDTATQEQSVNRAITQFNDSTRQSVRQVRDLEASMDQLRDGTVLVTTAQQKTNQELRQAELQFAREKEQRDDIILQTQRQLEAMEGVRESARQELALLQESLVAYEQKIDLTDEEKEAMTNIKQDMQDIQDLLNNPELEKNIKAQEEILEQLEGQKTELEEIEQLTKDRIQLERQLNEEIGKQRAVDDLAVRQVQLEDQITGNPFNRSAILEAQLRNNEIYIQQKIREARALGIAGEALTQYEADLRRVGELEIEAAFIQANPFIQQFEQSLTDVLLQVQSIEDAALALFRTIASEVIKITIARPIARMVGGIFGGMFGTGGILGFNEGGLVGDVPNLAKGGMVQNLAMGGTATELGLNAIVALQREKVMGGGTPVLAALTEGEYVIPKKEVPAYMSYKRQQIDNRNMQEYAEVKNFARGGAVGNNSYRSSLSGGSGKTYVINTSNSINLSSPNQLGESMEQLELRREEEEVRIRNRFG